MLILDSQDMKKSFQNDFVILKNGGPAGPYVDYRRPDIGIAKLSNSLSDIF